MRRLFFIIFIMAFMPIYAEAQTSNPDFGEDFDVSITPTNPAKPPKPRTLEADIEAVYSSGIVTIVFNVDLGNAHIEISNYTTGDVWSDSVSGIATLSMLLSGDEGYYVINIYTDEGDYVGEFYL